jgi:hypothetical protein
MDTTCWGGSRARCSAATASVSSSCPTSPRCRFRRRVTVYNVQQVCIIVPPTRRASHSHATPAVPIASHATLPVAPHPCAPGRALPPLRIARRCSHRLRRGRRLPRGRERGLLAAAPPRSPSPAQRRRRRHNRSGWRTARPPLPSREPPPPSAAAAAGCAACRARCRSRAAFGQAGRCVVQLPSRELQPRHATRPGLARTSVCNALACGPHDAAYVARDVQPQRPTPLLSCPAEQRVLFRPPSLRVRLPYCTPASVCHTVSYCVILCHTVSYCTPASVCRAHAAAEADNARLRAELADLITAAALRELDLSQPAPSQVPPPQQQQQVPAAPASGTALGAAAGAAAPTAGGERRGREAGEAVAALQRALGLKVGKPVVWAV